MSNKPSDESGAKTCGSTGSERNRYFTGKYMAARDFSVEQEYFLSHHRMHNRVLHGWGVVCGLRVVPHPDEECRKKWVVVRAGIAIDCYGRELVLCEDTPFKLPLPDLDSNDVQPLDVETDETEALQHTSQQPPGASDPQYEVRRKFLLCLRYTEEKIERVPALYSEGACDPGQHEYNRVRETAELVVLDPEEVPDCWKRLRSMPYDPDDNCCDDCDDEIPGPAGICLEPSCPCQDTVPLALIRWVPRHHKYRLHINMEGRRTLPPPPEFLTHIVGINWPHGETVTTHHLRHEMKGRLEIYFDRKILPADGLKTGINEFTFVVQYSDIQRGVEFLPIRHGHGPKLDGPCRAVYTIDPDILTGDGRGLTLSNHMVFVTMYCDFILDCHHDPVDGNFLGAKFPTGNGVKGSTFRSWFRVRER